MYDFNGKLNGIGDSLLSFNIVFWETLNGLLWWTVFLSWCCSFGLKLVKAFWNLLLQNQSYDNNTTKTKSSVTK